MSARTAQSAIPTNEKAYMLPLDAHNADPQSRCVSIRAIKGICATRIPPLLMLLLLALAVVSQAQFNLSTNNPQEYANRTSANEIKFTIDVPNDHVQTGIATLTVNVEQGQPAKIAIVVDSDDFSKAVWKPYQATPTVDLGDQEGWHDVWIGLRGSGADTEGTWGRLQRLKLDHSPPLLTVASPTNGATVTQQVIQLRGSCAEALKSTFYDIANTNGLLTNQEVSVVGETYAPYKSEVTPITFRADVPLAMGVNTITFHAMDLAGNVTALTTSVTLDYTGKPPPVIQLDWPTAGMEICGDTFSLHGHVNDPTTLINATITPDSGETATISGVVERNGKFWVQNIPLNRGTNTLEITAKDALCSLYPLLTNKVSIQVSKGDLDITMDEVDPPEKLWEATVNLTGTISGPNAECYAIWVTSSNRVVRGWNDGHRWGANGVPVDSGGMASFIVTAYGPGEIQPDPGHTPVPSCGQLTKTNQPCKPTRKPPTRSISAIRNGPTMPPVSTVSTGPSP